MLLNIDRTSSDQTKKWIKIIVFTFTRLEKKKDVIKLGISIK